MVIINAEQTVARCFKQHKKILSSFCFIILTKARIIFNIKYHSQDLQYALRRAGQNPTDVEVQDLINKIDDGTGTLDFNDFCLVIKEKTKEPEHETHFKDTFRAFSKDDEGCIPADEMKYVLMHLPGKITYKEIDEMIHTVDKNGDGKIREGLI